MCLGRNLTCSKFYVLKQVTVAIWLLKYPLNPSVCVLVLVAQSCPTLCDPRDSSPPGSSVHAILQARILEWVAIPFSRGSSQPRDQTRVFCIASRFFIKTPNTSIEKTVFKKTVNKHLLSTFSPSMCQVLYQALEIQKNQFLYLESGL